MRPSRRCAQAAGQLPRARPAAASQVNEEHEVIYTKPLADERAVVGAEAAKRSRAQVRTISLTSAHSLAPLLGPMCMETWASVNPVPPRRREEGVLARIDHADPARSAEQAADAAAYAAGVQLSERLSIVEM